MAVGPHAVLGHPKLGPLFPYRTAVGDHSWAVGASGLQSAHCMTALAAHSPVPAEDSQPQQAEVGVLLLALQLLHGALADCKEETVQQRRGWTGAAGESNQSHMHPLKHAADWALDIALASLGKGCLELGHEAQNQPAHAAVPEDGGSLLGLHLDVRHPG